MTIDRTCIEPDCSERWNSRRLCAPHYRAHRKAGTLPPVYSRNCSVDGCAGKHAGRGYCGMHLKRANHGTPMDAPVRVMGVPVICLVDECSTDIRFNGSRGYCEPHYRRVLKYGDPIGSRPDYIGARFPTPDGYMVTKVADGRWLREHRVVMKTMLGRELLPGENVHHLNGIRDDNRPENLELWIVSQPCGQRREDVVAHALSMLRRYASELLADA